MNKRQQLLLDHLLSQESFISSKKLAGMCQVSSKTIYSDLIALDSFLGNYSLKIKRVPRHGILIEGSETEKIKVKHFLKSKEQNQVTSVDYKEREDYYLRKFLIEDDLLTILDLSLELFISETSVRRDLEKLHHLLEKYGLALEKEQGYFGIKGEEKQIRFFLRTYLMQSYSLDLERNDYLASLQLFFSKELVTKVQEVVSRTSKLYECTIPSQYMLYLILDLLINVNRIKRGNSLGPLDKPIDDDLGPLELYPFAGAILSQSLALPLEKISSQEVGQIASTLISFGYLSHSTYTDEFTEISSLLIDKVSELAGIDFRKDLYLREQITNHMKPMVYRLKNGINIENQTTEEIKKRYSILFHIVWLASKTVSDSYQLEFLNAEIAFLTIYFEIAVERLEKPLHIYVVCPHGLATSELIINSLKRIISSYDYLQKIDLVDVTDQLALKADIIISSVLLENFDHPYILVSPLLSQEENDIIQREYRRLTDGNRKILSVVKNEKQLNHSIIRNLLGQNIHLQKECQTKETCMSFLVSQAYEENRQAPSFLQSILERERLGSTSIYTGIALPHANPQKVQKSQLSLLTLKEPIEWGQNMVKVVLLIAIKEGEEEHCKEALIYLYSKIDDLDFINKLAKATDKYDVYTTLFLEEK